MSGRASNSFRYRIGSLLAVSAVAIALAGCSHRAQVTRSPAPPPLGPPESGSGQASEPSSAPAASSRADSHFVATHAPLYSEEGVATWYDAPGHRAANGQPFNRNALTAAHRTLPMGSLLVVTNEKTNQSAIVHVTDRGPFIKGRTIDLSIASAKATGVYRQGLANVRIDVYETPRPMFTGGRWCVQIGALERQHDAEKLEHQLERKYPDAQVISFQGDTGYWVRIRPVGDNREIAEQIAARVKPAEGDAFLTRLD